MERLITKKLIEWSKDKYSLPLFVIGARQIGKTYSVLKFAQIHYKDKYIYLNFLERNKEYELLKNTNSPKEIIETLRIIKNENINESWLIIFDEIQEMKNIRSSLKHFVEQDLNYKIICLGSYLGNILNDKESFPVGKIQTLKMYPMNFEEFLMARKQNNIIQKIKDCLNHKTIMENNYNDAINQMLIEFMLVGGMPKVLDQYLKNNNTLETNKIKEELMESYKSDIIKYINNNSDKLKCQTIYENISNFLAKQNNKFKLTNIDNAARYLNYENAIKSLLITRIAYKINNLETFSAPIKTHIKESEFKIYYNDPGFITNIFGLNQEILLNNNDYANIRGSLFENYVLSELVQKIDIQSIVYFAFRDKNKNPYEIDFCIEDIKGDLIPIEVKSNKSFKTKSLDFLLKTKEISTSIILSMKNFNYENPKKIKIPLYALSFLEFENNRINIEKIK